MKNKIKDINILDHITKKKRVTRMFMLILGAFIFAIFYNAYVAPNNLVYGGVGGLAIVIHKLTGVSNILIIDIVTVALLLISIFTCGLKKASYTIIGFGVYTLFVNLTEPIAQFFQINFDSFTFAILFYSIVGGLGVGLIYRAGFNTGGVDSIVMIIQRYFKIPQSVISVSVNSVIIIMGVINFGIIKSIYAILLLKIMNFISDRIVLGMSNSKICYIKTRHLAQVEELLSDEFNIGYTLIDSTNGVGMLKKPLILCIMPSDRFYTVKNRISKIDKKVEFISGDCYTVEGGMTNHILPI